MDAELAIKIVKYGTYDEKRWKVVDDWVDAGHHKHDVTNYYSVVFDKDTGDFWSVNFQSSYLNGLNEHSVDFYKVKKVEVVTYEWHIV